jgi:DNA-binding Xre family transcriptional regulator
MGKPTHVKPGLYTMYYEQLKDIAKQYGYNLVIHGSMSRDLDLIAIPWTDNPQPAQKMIQDFEMYLLDVKVVQPDGNTPFTILPGGRKSYTISLNRGDKHGEWVRFEDKEYYLDISVTPCGGKEDSTGERQSNIQIVMPSLLDFDFRQLRKAKGLTLREVEESTGISNAYLSQLETGKIKSPGYDTVKKLHDLYCNGA